jgi:hypothetical protein
LGVTPASNSRADFSRYAKAALTAERMENKSQGSKAVGWPHDEEGNGRATLLLYSLLFRVPSKCTSVTNCFRTCKATNNFLRMTLFNGITQLVTVKR